jgi:hypothetical protein
MRLRRYLSAVMIGLTAASATLDAQSVRGSVIDDVTRLPVSDVLVTLVGNTGADVGRGVRTDTSGAFTVHAPRQGTYRIRAMKIGYRPLTSDALSLGPGELANLQLTMTTTARELVAVRVVERRALTLTELMSAVGFDLRESKGVGKFLNAQQLAEYGLEGAGEVLRSYMRPAVGVVDGRDGTYLTMRRCSPEIYVDGNLLGGKENAFAMIEAHPANKLHGIEIYAPSQVPPPSMGGTLGSIRGCAIAIWTKAARDAALRRASPPRQ